MPDCLNGFVIKILSEDEIEATIGKSVSFLRKCSDPDQPQQIDHKDSFTHNVVHQLSLFDDVECDDFSKINKSKLIKYVS